MAVSGRPCSLVTLGRRPRTPQVRDVIRFDAFASRDGTRPGRLPRLWMPVMLESSGRDRRWPTRASLPHDYRSVRPQFVAGSLAWGMIANGFRPTVTTSPGPPSAFSESP